MSDFSQVHEVRKPYFATQREKGTDFEERVLYYFQNDPTYRNRFGNVWMFKDWPGAQHDRRDTGIDLVAEELDGSGFCAIQCKSYSKDHSIQKGDIDSFFTASGKQPITSRIIISTTDKWSALAGHLADSLEWRSLLLLCT